MNWTSGCLRVIGTLIFVLAASASNAADSQPTTVRVGWIGDTHFTDMYVMSNSLTDPNVKLDMLKFQLSQDELNALASNKLDMASMGYIFFLKLLDKHVDVTAVSGVSERGTRLLLRKGLKVGSWNDFTHLKVGIARGSTQDLQFRSCLKQNGIDPNKINYTVFTNAVDMMVGLEQKSVDAAVVWEPQASQAILKGVGTEFQPVYPCSWSSNGMLVVRTEFLKAHPKVVTAIVKSLSEAAARLTSDPTYWVSEAQKFAPLAAEIQSLAIQNSGQSVVLHVADLPKMAKLMYANSYLQRDLEAAEIDAHIDLAPLEAATGRTREQLDGTRSSP